MSARTGGLLSVWVVLILIAPVGYAQSVGTLESPPLDRPRSFF